MKSKSGTNVEHLSFMLQSRYFHKLFVRAYVAVAFWREMSITLNSHSLCFNIPFLECYLQIYLQRCPPKKNCKQAKTSIKMGMGELVEIYLYDELLCNY